jgi:hypothetical protein
MKQFELNEKTFQYPENWQELSVKRYVNIARLQENKTDEILGELFLLKMIEALCDAEDGELDDLTLEIVHEISTTINFLQDNCEFPTTKYLEIDGVTYVFPNDLNKLTMGEYISMKTFQENLKSQAEAMPYILAIILRPGQIVKDEETGEEKWVQDKFTANNIEWRKNLFLEQPVYNMMGPINFFLGGKQ